MQRRRQSTGKKLIAVFLFLLIFSFVILTYLKIPHRIIGNYLAPSDQLMLSDAIVVVSGSSDRLPHAVSLFKQGLASKLILSGASKESSTSNAKTMQNEAIKAGVPNEAVIVEEKATNTYENALFTKDIIVSSNFKRIILVSSPYHQRRVYETFKKVLKRHNVSLLNSPSKSSPWKADNWWTLEKEKKLTKDEVMKIFLIKILGKYY